MEIDFQNKLEDNEKFYDYLVRETEQGRITCNRVIFNRQLFFVYLSIMIFVSLYIVGIKSFFAFIISVVIFLLFEAHFFIQARFKPRYFYGKWVYRHGEANIPPKYQEVFLLPKKMKADSNWLEITNPIYSHRFRWEYIERISLTTDFIFIHIVAYPTLRIPKRDFASESDFLEFGTELRKLFEANKIQVVESE